MQALTIKIKLLNDMASIPSYSKEGDAGIDLVALSRHEDGDMVTYSTGIAVEIPEGYVGLIFPRSSVYRYDLDLSNAVGVVDSGYRGEILFKFRKTFSTKAEYMREIYQNGERVGQLIILPYPKVKFEQVEELSSSERGSSGWGSSGK